MQNGDLNIECITCFTLKKYILEMIDQVIMTVQNVIEYMFPYVEHNYLCD